MKHIVFTVTNQLNYDQRMIRICTSLVQHGYSVTLVGIKNNTVTSLAQKVYNQKRLTCFFRKGFLFYMEYSIRLFFFLLFFKADVFCCIDLDTLLPVYFSGKLKGKKIVYDAHEYFSQQKEIITRPKVYKVWHWIERKFLPKIKNGYTVSYSIAQTFKKLYGVDYEVVMNVPVLKQKMNNPVISERIILYQGAVNHARGFEFLIPAMQHIHATLHIYGEGNFLLEAEKFIQQYKLQHKVILKGKVLPEELEQITQKAYMGINLVEHIGLNQYYSLANKFFDYIHAAIPQVTMNFPEYKRINKINEVAVLIDDMKIETIVKAINLLLTDKGKYNLLQANCLKAKEQFNWQQEEKKLIEFYKSVI